MGGGGTAECAEEEVGARALAAAGLTLSGLKAALRAEEEARWSEATQAAYGTAESDKSDADWLEVTDELQRRVLRGAGVSPPRLAAALFVMRAASQLFPDDAEVQQASLYVRYNRARPGNLRAGDALPDVPLYSLQPDCKPTSLRAACAGPVPTLLVAGSWT